VDLEGAGEGVTKLTAAGGGSATAATLTASGIPSGRVEVRSLTVESSGGGAANATAIYLNASSPRLTHVTATASGAVDNRGVYLASSSSPAMTHVTATAMGGTGSSNYGVYSNGSGVRMTHGNAIATGGSFATGVGNYAGSSANLTDVTVVAQVANQNIGVLNSESTSTITGSRVVAFTAASSWGIYNQNYSASNWDVKVDRSLIAGTSNTIWSFGPYTNYVGASQLDGGAVSALAGSTFVCTGVYSAGYVALGTACQ
jgi:hypothetical protein